MAQREIFKWQLDENAWRILVAILPNPEHGCGVEAIRSEPPGVEKFCSREK
jgi:hypothetical protein